SHQNIPYVLLRSPVGSVYK
ncbi:hypothetical protein AZ035_004855, partial [Klebsiella aerogenes]